MKYKETFEYRLAKILSYVGAYALCTLIGFIILLPATGPVEAIVVAGTLLAVLIGIIVVGISCGILALYQYLTLKPVDIDLHKIYDNFLKEKLCTKEG